MNRVKWIRVSVLFLCLLFFAVLSGCATGGSSGGGRSRGSLSAATTEAAGKEEETGRGRGATRTKDEGRTGDSNSSYGSYDNGDYGYYEDESDDGGNFLVGLFTSLFSGGGDNREYEDDSSPVLTDYSRSGNEYDTEVGGNAGDSVGGKDIEGSNVNFWFSRSRLGGDTVDRFTQYTLMYSWYTGPRYRAHVGAYWGTGKPGSQGDLKEGIRWISESGIDIGTRGYLTPKHSLLGLYLIAGIRVGAMYWSYNTALESVDEEGNPEHISHDGLMMFVPYAGLGTSLLQTKSVHLGVNVTLGGRLAVDKTFQDYENDLIRHVGEYKLNIEASIFF